MVSEPIDITILTYDRDAVADGIEIFWLWHGAEHRMAELIEEWGDILNWKHNHNNGEVVASNSNLGAVIKLFKRRIQEGGSKR